MPPRSRRSSDRLEAIIFGAGDLSASLDARVDGNFDPVGRLPRRLLALRPGPGAGRGTGGRVSTPSTPVPGLPGPGGLSAGGPAGQRAGLRRQMGHPPLADRRSPTTCFPRPRKRWPRLGHRWPPIGAAEAEGVGAIGRDGGSSTRPTCAWPPIACTRRRWPDCLPAPAAALALALAPARVRARATAPDRSEDGAAVGAGSTLDRVPHPRQRYRTPPTRSTSPTSSNPSG